MVTRVDEGKVVIIIVMNPGKNLDQETTHGSERIRCGPLSSGKSFDHQWPTMRSCWCSRLASSWQDLSWQHSMTFSHDVFPWPFPMTFSPDFSQNHLMGLHASKVAGSWDWWTQPQSQHHLFPVWCAWQDGCWHHHLHWSWHKIPKEARKIGWINSYWVDDACSKYAHFHWDMIVVG